MRIFSYIIPLISFCFFYLPEAFSQEKEEKKVVQVTDSVPWLRMLNFEIDLASPIISLMSKDDIFSAEGNLRLGLKERYFPILEFGFAKANTISPNNARFFSKGGFFRVGLDYNLVSPGPANKMHKYAFIGGRFGLSHLSYDLQNILIKDDYWNEEETKNFTNIRRTQPWVEAVFGLRLEVTKNIYLGWSLRMRILLGEGKAGAPNPWYIPGVGIKSLGTWGVNYTIGYGFNL